MIERDWNFGIIFQAVEAEGVGFGSAMVRGYILVFDSLVGLLEYSKEREA